MTIYSTPARVAVAVGVLALALTPAAAVVNAAADDGTAEAMADLKPGQIVTVVGTGEYGDSADGEPARDAGIGRLAAVDVGPDGTVYFVETVLDDGTDTDRLRMVTPDGVIETVPGAPTATDRVDGGGFLRSVAVGADGTVYVGRTNRLQRSTPDGDFVSVAEVEKLVDIAVAADGTVYVAETAPGRIRKITDDGETTTIAGGGDLGPAESEGAAATDVELGEVGGLAVDSSGNVYVTEHYYGDDQGARLRRISADGTITTVVGLNSPGFSGDGGPAAEAQVSGDLGRAVVDSDGTLYFADQNNGVVRSVSPDGVIATVPGPFSAVVDVAVGPGGELYVGADNRVVMRAPTGDPEGDADPVEPPPDPWADEEPGTVITVAGTGEHGSSGEGGPAVEAELMFPDSIAVGADGMLYVVEQQGKRLLAVDPGGALASVVNVPDAEYPLDQVESMTAVAPGPDGTVYLAAGGRVSRVYPDGAAVLVAGGAMAVRVATDHASAATVQIDAGARLASAPDGTLYISEAARYIGPTARGLVYRLEPDGTLTTVAEDAELTDIDGIAVDADGNIYAADVQEHRLRKVDPDGAASVVAGNGSELPSSDDNGDGGQATDAVLGFPSDVAVDADGTIYVSTGEGIRKVDGDGTISTVGEGEPFAGLGGLAFDAHGNLYFSETQGDRVRVLVRPGEIQSSSPWAVAGVAAGGVVVIGAGVVALLLRRRRQRR